MLGSGQPEDAWQALARLESAPTAATPQRRLVEIINVQARAALAVRDQERFCKRVATGRHRAVAPGSQQRYQQTSESYWQAGGSARDVLLTTGQRTVGL